MPQPITWLLPVKNAMPYLTQTLASIEAQSYPHGQVLAWDNGSSDGSVQELRRWIPRRLPGRVIADKPMGLGACLAQMVEQARTPLCARVDGDDVNLPNRLEKQVAFMANHPQVAVVGTDIQFIDEHGTDRPGAWSVATDDADVRWRLRFCNALNHPTVVFRRSAILAAGNYRDIMPGQDYDLWVRVAQSAAMANLPDRLVRYRLLPSGVGATHHGRTEQLFQSVFDRNTAMMFPGLGDEEAARLRELLAGESDFRVTLADCWRLRRCATQSARLIGQHDRYFRGTSLYRQQFKRLTLRWFKQQPGAAAAWPVFRRIWQHKITSHKVGGPSHELG